MLQSSQWECQCTAHERRCEKEGAAGGRLPREKHTSSRRCESHPGRTERLCRDRNREVSLSQFGKKDLSGDEDARGEPEDDSSSGREEQTDLRR